MNQENKTNGSDAASHLTKREHFTAMALQGIVAGRYDSDPNWCARKAVELADAMIQALNAPSFYVSALTKIADGQANLTVEEKRAIEGLAVVSREHARRMLDKVTP